MRKIIGRADVYRLPSLPLPFYVRSVGYNEAPPGWEERERSGKPFVQIFWCIQGVGEFQFNDRKVLLHADEAIFRLPSEEHLHRSVDSITPWHYRWFAFDGPGAQDFLLSYGYEQRPYHAGSCPVHLFSELETLVVRRTPYAQRHALSVAAEILALFGCDNGDVEHSIVRKFIGLVDEHYSDPSFSVDAAAEKLQVHRVTLYRLVRKELNTSPKQYLQQHRLSCALSLLVETELPVKCVAGACGFGKADRFCAAVMQATGVTPKRYRSIASADSR